MRINTNITSLISYNSLSRSTGMLERTIERLSTGLRINSASDDAAGLAISEKMNAQARGIDQAYRNAQDGISLLQTADGALGEIQSIAQRMRELSVQAANGTLTSEDRSYIQLEIDQLTAQINDIATQTQFNRKKLLDGSAAVLWSTSSRDLGVIVTGSLLGRDRFGQVTNAEGNYKITFASTVVGRENVQKSNVLTLKHGTSQANVDIRTDADGRSLSGLTNLQALNMVEGSWHVETRERPFGGVRYYHAGALTTAGTVGAASVDATPAPNIVAYGDYDIRLADKVPMMATFDSARMDGIGISSSNLSRDLDAAFSVSAGTAGTGATKMLHENAGPGTGGGTPAVTISDQATANVFTHYQITDVDARDTLNSQIEIEESYVTARDAAIDVTYTYNSGTQAAATANFTYQTIGTSTVTYDSTWRSNTTSLTYRVNYSDGSASINRSIPMGGTGKDIAEIAAAVNTAMTGPNGSNGGMRGLSMTRTDSSFTLQLVSSPGNYRPSGGSPTYGNANVASIEFYGALADALGLSGHTITKDGPAVTVDSGLDYHRTGTITVGGGLRIGDVASEIDAQLDAVGIGATASTGQNAAITLRQEGTGTAGNNRVTFSGATGAFTELGLGAADVTNVANNAFTSAVRVMDNYSTNITTLQNASIGTVQTNLSTALRNANTGITTAMDAVGADRLSSFHINNTSMYRVTVNGGAIAELTNGAGLTSERGTASGSTRGVYNGVTERVAVSNADLLGIRNALNTSINSMLGRDGINVNEGVRNIVSGPSANANNATISLANSASSGYNISIANGGMTPLTEMWTGGKTANRGNNTITSSGIAYRYRHAIAGTSAGQQMAATAAAIDGVTNLSTAWVTGHDATDDGTHWGRFTISNTSNANSSNDDTRRIFDIIDTGTDKTDAEGGRGQNYHNTTNESATSRLMAAATTRIGLGGSAATNIWQVEDAFKIAVAYEGNRADGSVINSGGSRTVGSGAHATYANRAADGADWLWEGTDEAGRNADRLNAQVGRSIQNGFFTGLSVTDTPNAAKSDTDIGDSWMMFTTARTAGGSTVSVDVGDSRTGDQTSVEYAFNAGVLNGGRANSIAQMLYVKPAAGDPSTYESLTHHLQFGADAEGGDHTFSYGERAGAVDGGDMSTWAMGNEGNVSPWYAHTYYGDSTTYHFQHASPDQVIRAAAVDRQNDINGSILFYKDGGTLKYLMKGIRDDGTAIGSNDAPMSGTVTIAPDGTADIEGIKFTNLNINAGAMADGDKFVVNVAAAAKLGTANTTGAAGGFESAANIQVTGSPFQIEEGGSTAQYRLASGAENGATLDLLGFYISPTNGANNDSGVGYYDGTIQLKVDGGGFVDGSTVGHTTVLDTKDNDKAYTVHTEVNYQGLTQFSAGALVTSAWFQKMDTDPSLVVADFVSGVSYSDYKFGFRDDGTYGHLKDPGKEAYSDINGSLIFEVMELEPNVLTFRVQGHFIDRQGNEYYAEEEAYRLNAGRNTDKDMSDTTLATNDDPHAPVHMFRDSDFGGVYFDELKLGDIERWSAGDRFTVILTASGFKDGIAEADQNDPTKPDTYSTIDEIGIFSDDRGTVMPASFRFDDGVLDNSSIDIHIYQLADNLIKEDSPNFSRDQVMDGTLTLTFGEAYNNGDPDAMVPRAATFDVVYGRGSDYGAAHYYSNAEDVAQFYDNSGRYILADSAQGITIRQGTRETTVQIGSGTEIGELTRAMSSAIWNDLLKQYQHAPRGEDDLLDQEAEKPHMLDEADKNKLVQFVNTAPGKSANEAVVGTMLAHSVLAGERSALEFYGSEELLRALAFTTVQTGTDNEFSASVADAHTGRTLSTATKVVAGTTTADLMMDGISIRLDTDLGILRATFDKSRGSFMLDVKDDFSEIVHLADSTMSLQIGANEGENVFLNLGDMSASALGIDDLSVRTQASASRSITRIDGAISRISRQRAVIGAQINRLEHTMTNLANTSTNLKGSRSRIADADLASEMMKSAKLNIIMQAGTSMLAQANQLGSNVMVLLR